ncbi:MAG: hypothetical protein REI78_04800 [Pedobacter sp.]|nr:hypothetical protein [Pedobacter sp.]MDQ8052316.1 hypothetical protein [Pedobacter sp.]
MNLRFFIFSLLTLGLIGTSRAQHTFNVDHNLQFNAYQDSLQILSDETFAAKDDQVRLEKNAAFIKKFVTALKITGSFGYGFDSLKRISIIKSPDNAFRIITWFVPLNDGTYRFYGTIQMGTTNGALKLHPLNDGTSTLADANAITSNKNWYGARYYEMVPVIVNGKQPYWIFLGWKGNNQKTSKKVIDVLSFEKGEPVFGKEIFQASKNGPYKNRVVFEYSKLNSMTLTVDQNVKMIVFDHLAPYDPKMADNYEFYASDLSFDGYKLAWGKLALAEDVELKNEPSPNDDFYGKPVKASMVIIKSNE